MNGIRSKAVLGLSMMLGACVLAPPVVQPVLVDRVSVANPATTARALWPETEWWKGFGDSQLDALIAEGLRNGPSLKTAQARVAAADASAVMNAADAGARLSAEGGFSRQRLSKTGFISSRLIGVNWFNQANAGLDFEYDFDWWGRQQAGITEALDSARAAAAEQKTAELILVSAITSNYFGWQTEDMRLRATHELGANLEAQRTAQAERVAQGIESVETLDGLDMERGQAGSDEVDIIASRFFRQLALAALLGVPVERVQLQPRPIDVRHVALPADAGLGLIARRPDILASRWRVEAATQDVAQARAGYYPDIRLSALAGLATISPAQFFNPGSRVASFGAAVYLPIFDLKRVKARHGLSRAQLDLAIALYNETVNNAAIDVARQVAAQYGFARQQQALKMRWVAAQDRRDRVAERYRAGLEDSGTTLSAEAEVLRARIALLKADDTVVSADLGLIKALGGGFPAEVVAAAPQARKTQGLQ